MVGYGAEGMALRFSAAAAPRRLIWFSAVAIWPAISLVLGEALQTASMRPGAKRRDHAPKPACTVASFSLLQ